MKKFMALALAAIMLVTFAACAMAETAFEFRASCTDTNAIAYDTNGAHQEYKTKNNHQVYVRHWVIGGSDQYTNLLRQEKLWKVLLIVEANGLLLV